MLQNYFMLIERKEFKEEDGSIGYIESVFLSKNVLKATYFPKNNLLYIAFSRGSIYSYQNITSEIYNEFECCDSQGSFFFKKINKNKSFPTRKEYTLYPNELRDLKVIIENNKPEDDYDE